MGWWVNFYGGSCLFSRDIRADRLASGVDFLIKSGVGSESFLGVILVWYHYLVLSLGILIQIDRCSCYKEIQCTLSILRIINSRRCINLSILCWLNPSCLIHHASRLILSWIIPQFKLLLYRKSLIFGFNRLFLKVNSWVRQNILLKILKQGEFFWTLFSSWRNIRY